MIAWLSGIVREIGADHAVLEVNGVGYLISASGRTLGALRLGQAAMLHIETVVREDAFLLYAFQDRAEREWFRLLQTVQGVGGRVALALLTVLSPDLLAQAIASGDKATLARADGVGPKLAARLMSELKDKAGNLALGMARPMSAPTGAGGGAGGEERVVTEAISALVNLGYGRSEAFGAIRKQAEAVKATGKEIALADLIRAGLKDLTPP